MEKLDILKMVEPGVSQTIVAMELDRIEMFAASTNVPFELWHRSQFEALGFVFREEKLTEDGHTKFIEASAPDGWTRRLVKSFVWIAIFFFVSFSSRFC